MQKRQMLMYLKEAFVEYNASQMENPLSLAKFSELRPPQCIVLSQKDQNVCVCKHHEDIEMLLECLPNDVKLPATAEKLVEATICTLQSLDCAERNCDKCGLQMLDNLQAEDDRNVTFYQWERDDGLYVKMPTTSMVQKCLSLIADKLETFALHCFNAKQQHIALSQLKKELSTGTVVLQEDFAENYSCKQQNEIMSAHWKSYQVTVFTAVAWYKNSDGELKHKSYAVVSDCLDHNKSAVHSYNRIILNDMKKHSAFEHVHYWSDGAASQFKPKFNINNLVHHYADTGLTAEWSFFGSNHGKGPVDGIGGCVKRSVYLAVLQNQEVVNDYKDFLRVAQAKNEKIIVLPCQSQVVENTEKSLALRYASAPELPGIRHHHHFIVKDGHIKMYRNTVFSASPPTVVIR